MRVLRLHISRFKSIKALDLQCRKVNVFIGPPDTGKSNILDALSFLSHLGWAAPLGQSLRLTKDQGFEPLFFRQFFDQPITIRIDEVEVSASLQGTERRLELKLSIPEIPPIRLNVGDQFSNGPAFLREIRFYAFAGVEPWTYHTGFFDGERIITPPHGANLIYIGRHNEAVYNLLKEQVANIGWKLRFDQQTKRFRLSEVRPDDIIDYNLEVLSDSIKRFFFYSATLVASRDAVLVFDEPDVQAFPPYPKELGRMIAEDETNQFFLTTHNPYILAELAEKTPKDDLAIFYCRRGEEDGTQARLLHESEVAQIIDWGASTFFNLKKFDW
ncbi:MAG TPA: AAA family ATPase [Polyangia bacterium]|jgi:hypothetical protein